MAKGNFGERLKRERELREVSPNEVVVATRISLRFLEALENEDWDKLPGGVFNRGFVRSIARYLGLDEEHLLAEYDLARGDQAPEFVSKLQNRIPQPSKWLAVGLALGALVVIAALVAAGIYGWRRYSSYRRAKPSSAITTQSLTAAQPVRQTRHFFAATIFKATGADSSAIAGIELPTHAVHRFPRALGTIVLSKNDLRPTPGGNSQR